MQAVISAAALLPLLATDRRVFDAAFYRSVYGASRLVRWCPLLEFALRGARRLQDPNPFFSQHAYARQWHVALNYPPILHFLLHGRQVAAPPVPLISTPGPAAASVETPPSLPVPAPANRLETLWPLLRADLAELQDVAHALTPTSEFLRKLSARRLAAPAPLTSGIIRAVMQEMPSKVDHLVLVPWLGISGGSEKVSQRLLQLLREHYHDGGLCVLAPDSIFDLAPDQRRRYGMPIVAINDADPQLDHAARTEIVDRILIELRPRTVHSINAQAAWLAFRHRARHYAQDSKLFGNIYSDIRIMEGLPVGAFWQFLPDALDHLTGVLADNRAVVRRAEQCFSLTPEQLARYHVVPTPILGLDGRDPGAELRPFRDPGSKRSLWMSRIAYEKRLDVLQAIAERCPDRSFSIYGATIGGGHQFDLSWIKDAPNVHMCGGFGMLADLPVETFDSYVFTTSAEGMPIAVLEAAMLGLPIVAPDVGGIGEFIDRSTGWLVSGPDAVDEYVAALEEIRRRPDEAARRVAAAQARLMERHSWANFRRTVTGIPGYLNGRTG